MSDSGLPFVESASLAVGAGATATALLARLSPDADLEIERWSANAGTTGTNAIITLLVNGRQEPKFSLGPATSSFVGHPSLTFPRGFIIRAGALIEVQVFNPSAGTINVVATLTGCMYRKNAA